MVRRLFALVLALLVAGASVSPCTAAAIARSGAAEPAQALHASHADAGYAGHSEPAPTASDAHGVGDCHGPSASIAAQCQCGCTSEGPRAAASPFSAPWALPAPSLPHFEEGNAPATPGPLTRPVQPSPSRIDHVPISV
jgi:hypothetical protein